MRALSTALAAEIARAAAYGGAILLSLIGDALIMRRELTDRLLALFALFALGAAFGALLTWPATRRVARNAPPSVRLATFLLLLAVSTAGFSALFFFLQTRAYYAVYYPMELTFDWFYHFAYTGAAATFEVVVLGLRYFLPLGLIPLFGAAFLFAAPPRSRL